jgi:hypothetical protein
VSFAAITFCVVSQRMFIVVYFVTTQSKNFWIHPRTAFIIAAVKPVHFNDATVRNGIRSVKAIISTVKISSLKLA